jgi:hypothetical protein
MVTANEKPELINAIKRFVKGGLRSGTNQKNVIFKTLN